MCWVKINDINDINENQMAIFRGVAFQGCHRKPQAAVANLRVWQSTVAGGGASENRMWQPGAKPTQLPWFNDGSMMVQ